MTLMRLGWIGLYGGLFSALLHDPLKAHPELTGTPAKTGTPDIGTRQRSQSTSTSSEV